MTPVNRNIIELWNRKKAFQDLDEPGNTVSKFQLCTIQLHQVMQC